jgi:N-glycosylase/DNA lyase
MLGLLGRPRGLAVDSWIRARLGGVTAAEIRARYEPAGRWGGALLWQDVTADWFT